MIDVNVAEAIYCSPLQFVCQPLSWWSSAAAWAQALLSVAAVGIAYLLTSHRERKDLSRKADVYVNLISLAEINSKAIAMYTPGDVEAIGTGKSLIDYRTQDFEQFSKALHSISLQELPDFRLLEPIRNAARTCDDIIFFLGRVKLIPVMSLSEEALETSERIREAQRRLTKSYESAAAIANEYGVPSLRQRWNRMRLWIMAPPSKGR
ncbi:TPA: hypothetical protein QDZ42_004310 [Stenotrophomonas maltophilia]|nr:hypothetical protein [Stenotrophomonas maltophilia]HDS1041306.1 hypothetical protein [Stenotrophomonas maltophilia]HDS1043827.1 hypothetical protein [Stenotrophomonas maltophilia]HDS1045609.1 hypothetical protein [Stenotrophomonas maltophilia]